VEASGVSRVREDIEGVRFQNSDFRWEISRCFRVILALNLEVQI
jgi:hypothetical protein